MSPVLGIDLGTTNSVVAIINGYGRPEVLVNDYGERITPSVVMVDGQQILVGTEAKNSAVLRPNDTVQFVKRQMGNPDWRFYPSSGGEYSAEHVSGLILKKLRQDAERALGQSISQAVISVPAYFDDAKRKATQDAGQIAGLEVLRIINEPTAAAIAHGLDSSETGRLLVFDLGGGTFDVTAMHVTPGNLDVRATGGDPHLGGFDWDNELMILLNSRFMDAGGPDLFATPESEQDLRAKVEQVKKRLSQVEHASTHVSASGFTERLTVTREEFDDATASLLDRCAIILDQVREEAGWQWAEVDTILLVGGSTRMPQVPALVQRLWGKRPSSDINPDEAVAMGAAIQAALLGSDEPGVPKPDVRTPSGLPVGDLAIRDVTAHSLGVVIVNDYGMHEVNSVIIPKNTPIPVKASQIYGTTVPRQSEYHCRVTEGEGEDLEYVRVVGEGVIRLRGSYDAGAPMEVSMAYDVNGIIHVYVTDLVEHRPLGELRIDRTSNLAEEEVAWMQSQTEGVAVE